MTNSNYTLVVDDGDVEHRSEHPDRAAGTDAWRAADAKVVGGSWFSAELLDPRGRRLLYSERED